MSQGPLSAELVTWHSMDTAPKDRNLLLVREAHADRPRSVTFGYWYEWEDEDGPHEPSWWSEDGGFTNEHPPIAWAKVPEPPHG